MAYLEELFVQNLRYFTEREILIRNEPEKRNNFTLSHQKRRNFSLSIKLESSLFSGLDSTQLRKQWSANYFREKGVYDRARNREGKAEASAERREAESLN